MGLLPNLIYYASVAMKDAHVVAEYNDGDGELPKIASKCLQLLPPYHSRFSHTTNSRMFACIIDEPFLYCTIADAVLRRTQVMSFLEQVRHEFISCVRSHGFLADHSRLEANSLDKLIDPIFRRLIGPFVGVPQKEKQRIAEEAESRMRVDAETDVEAGMSHAYYSTEMTAYDNYNHAPSCFDKSSGSRSPSTPLIGKSNGKKFKQKKHEEEARDAMENGEENGGKAFDKVRRMEIMKDGCGPTVQVQRLRSSKSFRGQQVAQRMWWKSVKLVLLLDAIICLIMFGIWLGVCHGFSCMKDK